LGCVDVVARVVRRELAAVRVERGPAVAGLRLVACFGVLAGFEMPGVLVDIATPYLRKLSNVCL
jgi:hypothetical protein